MVSSDCFRITDNTDYFFSLHYALGLPCIMDLLHMSSLHKDLNSGWCFRHEMLIGAGFTWQCLLINYFSSEDTQHSNDSTEKDRARESVIQEAVAIQPATSELLGNQQNANGVRWSIPLPLPYAPVLVVLVWDIIYRDHLDEVLFYVWLILEVLCFAGASWLCFLLIRDAPEGRDGLG